MSNEEELTKLIDHYLEEVAEVTAILERELGRQDLLRGVRSGEISESGQLSNGGSYQFHGTGCSVERGNIDLEFEFDSDGETSGFDSWRLHQFASNFKKSYPSFQTHEAMKLALSQAVARGILIKPFELPNRELCYRKPQEL